MKKHWPTLVIALALGFLTVLPFFYFQNSLGDDYKGILNQIVDDELFYMARIKDVIDGHPMLGNAYLWEHKDQLPQQLFLPEWLLAQRIELFNLDIVEARISFSFLFPALAFILTYIAFYLIYRSKFWANVFAVFLFFGVFLSKFTRPVIPQFVFIFWLTQFILLLLLIRNYRSKWTLPLSILNFGFLFYIYPFYWSFYLALFAILAVFYFFKDRPLSKKILLILVGGLAIGSFYFYLNFLASQLPEYEQTLTRLQMVFSRSPSGFKIILFSLAVLVIFWILLKFRAIKLDNETLFYIAGALSLIIVTNQNLITNRKFEFSSHYFMLAVFFLVFALYYLFGKFKNRLSKSRIAIFIVVVLFVFNGFTTFAGRTLRVSQQDIYAQKYRLVFDWLNENTTSDSVVYANDKISDLIPVYTANNVFYSRYANLFLMQDKEVEERFILNNFYEKFDRDFVIENERAIWGVRFIDRYGDARQANKWRKILGLKLKDETRLPEEEINRIIAKARQIQKEGSPKRLKKYRIDYIIWDVNKNSRWRINEERFTRKVFEKEGLIIYKP